jgi:hypothetical protein
MDVKIVRARLMWMREDLFRMGCSCLSLWLVFHNDLYIRGLAKKKQRFLKTFIDKLSIIKLVSLEVLPSCTVYTPLPTFFPVLERVLRDSIGPVAKSIPYLLSSEIGDLSEWISTSVTKKKVKSAGTKSGE